MTRFIPLTMNQITVVDDEDFDWLNEYKWCAAFSPNYSGGGYTPVRKRLGKMIRMHRAIMEHVLNRQLDRGEQIDHIDGEPLNNTRDNLRIVTHTQNMMNRNLHKDNTSGYKGVSYHKTGRKWEARIAASGKRRHLGMFDTPEEAHAAYEKAAIELHGDYRRV